MDARMISFWGCETNPCANPDTANNGGGYSQPSGGILVALENGEYLTVTVDDMSCGDFGCVYCRITIRVFPSKRVL